MPIARAFVATSLLAWLFLAACASVPRPEGELAAADLSLRKAEQAEAGRYAALELRVAREKLEEARAAARDDRNLEARRLAEQAGVDAQVAEQKARTAWATQAATAIREDIEQLQREAERAAERVR